MGKQAISTSSKGRLRKAAMILRIPIVLQKASQLISDSLQPDKEVFESRRAGTLHAKIDSDVRRTRHSVIRLFAQRQVRQKFGPPPEGLCRLASKLTETRDLAHLARPMCPALFLYRFTPCPTVSAYAGGLWKLGQAVSSQIARCQATKSASKGPHGWTLAGTRDFQDMGRRAHGTEFPPKRSNGQSSTAQFDRDGFQFRVVLQGRFAVFAPQARHFETAERG